MFTADRDACFGRVYDAAHLKSHPKQKVTSLHVLRSLETRREAENWTPGRARANRSGTFARTGRPSVSAFVTFRDRKGIFHNSLTCDKETRDGVRCMIECDGGSFRLARASANAVLLHNNGFVLVGGCGEEVEEGKAVHFESGRGRQGVPARQQAGRGSAAPRSSGRPRSRPACRCASDSRRTSSSASAATTTPRISRAIRSRW